MQAGLLDGQIDPLRSAPALLAQGWTVVVPDHQGPNAAFDHSNEHLTLNTLAESSVIAWLRERFAGVPVDDNCTITDVGSIAPGR